MLSIREKYHTQVIELLEHHKAEMPEGTKVHLAAMAKELERFEPSRAQLRYLELAQAAWGIGGLERFLMSCTTSRPSRKRGKEAVETVQGQAVKIQPS